MPKYYNFIIISFISFLVLSCAMKPKYLRPNAEINETWPQLEIEDFPKKDEKEAKQIGWKNFFQNQELQEIIDLALKNNHDYKIAALNIDAAMQYYRITRSNSLLSINADASYTKQRTPRNSFNSFGGSVVRSNKGIIIDNYRANLFSASFELDLFGRLRSLNESAFEDFLAKNETKNALKISLIAQIANSYIQILSDIEKLKITDELIKLEKKYLELIEESYKKGILSKIDFLQNQKTLQRTIATRAEMAKIVEQDQNELIALIGIKNDEKLKYINFDDLKINENFIVDLPSNVLLLRPDIAAAEHNLKAQNANIGAARAAFFPSISLTGSYGFASTKYSTLFSSQSRGAWSYTPKITIPLFSSGENIANLKTAKIEKQIAIEQYQKAIQTAFREVADELSARRNLFEEFEAYKTLTKANEELYFLYQKRFEQGSDDFFDITAIRRDQLSSKQQEIETHRQYLSSLINLYKALGGGLDE